MSDSGAISENCISEFARAFDFDKLVRDLIGVSVAIEGIPIPIPHLSSMQALEKHTNVHEFSERNSVSTVVANLLRKMTIKMCSNGPKNAEHKHRHFGIRRAVVSVRCKTDECHFI